MLPVKEPRKVPGFKRCLCRFAAPVNSHVTWPVEGVSQPPFYSDTDPFQTIIKTLPQTRPLGVIVLLFRCRMAVLHDEEGHRGPNLMDLPIIRLFSSNRDPRHALGVD